MIIHLDPAALVSAPSPAERSLWVEVVALAVQEAASGDPCLTQAARVWIFGPLHERPFFRVCDLAGLDPGWVRAQCLRRLEKQSRRDLSPPSAPARGRVTP